MTQEQIHSALDKMLENPKSKTFLNHLVRAYMPVTQIEKVWDKPTGDFKCVISRDSLVSVQEIFEGMKTEEYQKDFMNHLKSMFDENTKKAPSPMAKLLGDKKLGFTGKDTTTYMSYQVAQEFYNWVITKSLKGDKHINWLLGSIRRDSFTKRAEQLQDPAVQAKVNKIVGAKYTLGDSSDALQKLKDKLESSGK